MRKNLGWSLIEQGKIADAKHHFEKAIKIDESFPEAPPGTGMGYCMQSFVHASQQQPAQSFQQLDLCLQKARPETIQEYEWLVENLPKGVAQRIDTSGLVNGLEGKKPLELFPITQDEPINYQKWYEETKNTFNTPTP
ncbi:MAG: tetratricopeptide repeat protein [Coleofasciculus sp. G3-WIS-01]|uniref:tetratricopeptide repeat protein n=1 Tax=Coleofasciculus sp. G3-WIS-01 TaxID=3069528 RepID=UPI0032F170A7